MSWRLSRYSRSAFHVVGLKSDENRDKDRYKDDQRSKMNASLLFDVQKKVAEKEMNYINLSDGGTYISYHFFNSDALHSCQILGNPWG